MKPAIDLHQSWTLLAMVDAGMDFTVLPAISCRLEAYPRLCSRPVTAPSIEREIGIIKSSRRSLSQPARAFQESVFRFLERHKAELTDLA